MNEFEEKDYGAARSYADSIKTNADNIMMIFDDIDASMKSLYGESWQSTGADVSNGRYQQIRTNYELFYQNVVRMNDHIHKITTINEETDSNVGTSISEV